MFRLTARPSNQSTTDQQGCYNMSSWLPPSTCGLHMLGCHGHNAPTIPQPRKQRTSFASALSRSRGASVRWQRVCPTSSRWGPHWPAASHKTRWSMMMPQTQPHTVVMLRDNAFMQTYIHTGLKAASQINHGCIIIHQSIHTAMRACVPVWHA